MSMVEIIVAVVVTVVVLAVLCILYSCYVTVIRCKNSVLEALSGIDVQLKKRHDLVPNILTIAKRFMEHEKEIFENITELRSRAMSANSGTKEKFAAEAKLDNLMSQLLVNVEYYPELKSDSTMVQAMTTYNEVEEHIAAARRFYNSALTQLKNSTQIFPGSLFAFLAVETLGFSYFETDAASREAVSAGQYL